MLPELLLILHVSNEQELGGISNDPIAHDLLTWSVFRLWVQNGLGGKLQEQATRLQHKRSHRRVAGLSMKCMKSPLTGLSGIDAAAAAAADIPVQRLQQLPMSPMPELQLRNKSSRQIRNQKKTVKRGIPWHLLLHGFPPSIPRKQAGSCNTKSKTIQNFSAKHKPV